MMDEPQTFGKYRIVRELGRGSFGVVYLVENTSLHNRREALKVLYPQLLVDPETLRLFGQEAGLLAQLDHPNIVTVFETGEIGERRFIAMRYVPGRSLAQVLREESPQPLARVAEWLDEIASALDYAHEQGVLHRDIKPANILQDGQGRAVVTDLGLAKAAGLSGGSASQEKENLSGTVRYMAPEAFKGMASAQTDVYSLGVVLYELLTGQVPFDGPDFITIALRHTTEQARSLCPLRPDLPEAAEAVVLRAMAKQPADRYATAEELARAFRAALGAQGTQRTGAGEQAAVQETGGPVRPSLGRLPRWAALALTVALVLAILGMAALLVRGCWGAPPNVTASPSAPTGSPALSPTPGVTETIAPDSSTYTEIAPGARVVVQGTGPGLNLRASPSTGAKLVGTAKDGDLLLVLEGPREADGYTFWKVRTLDGKEAWAPGKFLVLSAAPFPQEIPPSTATPAPPTASPTAAATPLGGGGLIAFEADRDGDWEIFLINAASGKLTNLTNYPGGDHTVAWSPDGTRLAFHSFRDGKAEVYVMASDGSGQVNLTHHPADDGSPSWSPDGLRIVFDSNRDLNSEIYVMDADGSNPVNLSNHLAADYLPAWSPDGSRIAFQSLRDGNVDIYVMNADGTGGLTRLTNSPGDDARAAWSPDGKRVAFHSNRDGHWQVYVMNADGSGQTNISRSGADDGSPTWSPDGSLIAFDSNRDGSYEIWVMSPDGSGEWRLTNGLNAHAPAWSPR